MPAKNSKGGKGVSDDDKAKALDKLMKQTIRSAGAVAPDEIPHRTKDRLRGVASGEMHVDDYVKELKKPKKKR
jgi:hypothetical protein